ncbi:cation:proton antiporter [Natronomonas salina]|uniref:proton-conducting transporter transmembrane domain-containing protein n=1 Tax=Natronomonas salina TaxID=1710540 RepID=UPI0015B44220|nr:proton-conducting transporter membrane subunit [Natronomonas salina]QLD88630.1 cation:proton antiporter [Natronomonas salina]
MDDLRPLYAVLVSLVAMFGIFAAHRRPNVREAVTIVAAFAKFGIVASMVPGVLAGETYEFSAGEFVAGVEFVLRADPLGTLFAFLASLLWIVTSFYSIGYMRGLEEHGQTRYFASFAASLSATMGIAFAGNLVTIFLFYELLSVATYPLVAHDETGEARSAGRKYLAYTMFGGGVLVLAGTVLVFWLVGTVTFTAGGIEGLAAIDPMYARLAYAILAIGFGVKAGLMPLHQWLPVAMVAPTPVSGLLHAVAVVKSGAFGVARVTLYVFGPELAYDLGMAVLVSGLAAFTLLAASFIAIRKDHLKQRLAYSTVSQLSYIVLGLGLFGWHGLVGALLHIPAHAFMKLTLFFCAGAIHVETHTDHISKMAGIGRRMPVTLGCFALAAAGMAGMPLFAGFVSKYYMLIGGLEMGGVGLYLAGALLVSGVLNVAYFWPVVYTAFFETEDDHDAKPVVDFRPGGERRSVLPKADGGNPIDDAESDDAEADAEDGTSADGDADEDVEIDPADLQPDFSGASGERRDYSEPAPLVDGEYAVDQNPSDHVVEEEFDGPETTTPADDEAPSPEHHDDGHGGAHHEGPPAEGWRRLTPREALLGRETTWFMLGPIVAAATGAILLGVVPDQAVFLDLIEVIVDSVVAGTEVAR